MKINAFSVYLIEFNFKEFYLTLRSCEFKSMPNKNWANKQTRQQWQKYHVLCYLNVHVHVHVLCYLNDNCNVFGLLLIGDAIRTPWEAHMYLMQDVYFDNLEKYVSIKIWQLDGVGPVDTRPSTN